MPAQKKPAKIGPGVPKAPHASMKPARASARKKMPPFVLWFAATGGRSSGMGYGTLKPHGGGSTGAWTHLRVRDFIDKDSDAVATLPPAIVGARLTYPAYSFKAGHLINATFRGPGNNAKNLTILTASGNSRHKNFDNPVKEAFRLLRKAYEKLWKMGMSASDACLTIEVRVNPVGAWGVGMPDQVICNHLSCVAHLHNKADVVSAISLLMPPADPKLHAEYLSLVNRAQLCIDNAAGVIDNGP